MLQLKVNDRNLDLPSGLNINIVLKSPIFNQEEGDYSYSFKIPATDNNKDIFDFKHRKESTADIYQRYSAVLLFKNNLLGNGSILVKEADKYFYDIIFYPNSGDFNGKIKSLNLNTVDLGKLYFTDRMDMFLYFQSAQVSQYPLYPFGFPEIWDDLFLNPMPADPDLLYINKNYGGNIGSITPSNNQTLIVPFLYLRFVLDKVFECIGYKYTNDFFASTLELSQLMVFNVHDVNSDATGNNIRNVYLSLHLPNIDLKSFFNGLCNWFNISLFISPRDNKIGFKSNTEILNQIDYVDFSKNILDEKIVIEDKIKGVLFQTEDDQNDKYYQDKLVAEKAFIDAFKGSVKYFTDLPVFPSAQEGDIFYVESENCLYEYFWITVLNLYLWDFGPSMNFFSLHILNTLLDKKCSTIYSTLIDKTGNIYCGNAQENEKETVPRLIFATLEDNINCGRPYLVGHNSNSHFSLFYKSPLATPGTGLFDSFWKEWYNWIINKRKLYRFHKLMDYHEFSNIDFSKKYRINGRDFLLKEISVSLSTDKIQTAQIDAYLV